MTRPRLASCSSRTNHSRIPIFSLQRWSVPSHPGHPMPREAPALAEPRGRRDEEHNCLPKLNLRRGMGLRKDLTGGWHGICRAWDKTMGDISGRVNSGGDEAVDFALSIDPHTGGPGRSIDGHGRPSSRFGKEGTPMLVLSRRQGESIVIGQGIHVSVCGISRNRVRLAIEAPAEVNVDRAEVRLRKQIRQVEAPIVPIP